MLKIKNIIFKIFLELFVFNRKKRALIKARWAKKHLKKYVDYAVLNTNVNDIKKVDSNKIIWQYWHQGIENAPILMQKCVESVKTYHPECDIRVLSFDTIENYVDIPVRYYELLKKKKMPIALFSDILRLYLLTTYGGTWIDSTIYLTSRIPDEILESDFFVYQKDDKNDESENKMSCYFIHSSNNNLFLHCIKNTIEKYWSENDFYINYFMFEHIATMLSNAGSDLIKIWDNMPVEYTHRIGKLRNYLYEKFDINLYNELCEQSYINKLTWKTLKDKTSGNTIYDYIISR